MPLLPDDLVRQALTLARQGFAGNMRKREAWRRWLVLSEAHEPLVLERIAGTHTDKTTIEQLAKWIDVSMSLALDVMDEICVVWDKPATRSVGKPPEPAPPPQPAVPPPGPAAPPPFAEAADDPPALPEPPKPAPVKPKAKDNPETVALRKLYSEIGADSWLQDLNKAAWFLGPCVVIPRVTADGKMRAQFLLPHFYDVIPNPDDPDGEPLAYVYTTHRNDVSRYDHPEALGGERDGDVVILDSEAWRVYPRGASEPVQPQVFRHGLGYIPAVPLRFSRPLNGELWGDYRKHRRLLDATIAVNVISTQLQFVRKAQNKHLLLAIGQLPEGDDGETQDPETGRAIPTSSPGAVSVQTLPFDTAPDNFVKHISFLYQRLAASYGGESRDALSQGGLSAPRVTFSFEAQTEIRVDQIVYAREFERRLAKTLCDLAKASAHDLAPELPDAEEIEETFSVRFAPLSRKYANPADEITHFDFLKSNGVVSPYDLARREDPDLTTEQARNHVMARLEETSEVNSFAAERNMPMDGSGVNSVPEALGKLGPMARDSADAEEEENDVG